MAQGNGGGGSGWDYYDIISKHRVISFHDQKKGTCQFRMPDKTLCGQPFTGPPNKKYCSKHSFYIQHAGSNVALGGTSLAEIRSEIPKSLVLQKEAPPDKSGDRMDPHGSLEEKCSWMRARQRKRRRKLLTS